MPAGSRSTRGCAGRMDVPFRDLRRTHRRWVLEGRHGWQNWGARGQASGTACATSSTGWAEGLQDARRTRCTSVCCSQSTAPRLPTSPAPARLKPNRCWFSRRAPKADAGASCRRRRWPADGCAKPVRRRARGNPAGGGRCALLLLMPAASHPRRLCAAALPAQRTRPPELVLGEIRSPVELPRRRRSGSAT